MTTLREITAWMQEIAPLELSESWDNTGLLLGCPLRTIQRVQTCLTLSAATVEEAISSQADLVIAHHPLPFKPLSRITTESLTGRLLWQMANHGVAIYSPHTAWDSAPTGINALLAAILKLRDCQPLIPSEKPEFRHCGAGRVGVLDSTTGLPQIVEVLAGQIRDCRPRGVLTERNIERIAIACGSGGGLLPAAISVGCDLFLTGEASFHTCLEAEAAGVGLLMIGHYASERFAMENLADRLSSAFRDLECWPSTRERNPVRGL